MVCLYCDTKLQTVNSRHQKRTNSTWRRKACPACSSIFTSTENVDLARSLRFKTPSGAIRAFSRDNLMISVYECLKHRKTAITDATGLTDTVLLAISAHMSQPLLDRQDIILATNKVLSNFDTAAAVQYSAYHPL